MRIGKKGEPAIHDRVPDIRIGKCLTLRKGNTVGLLNAGNTLPLAMAAASELESRGVSTEVASFHTVKPLDDTYLQDAFRRFRLVATIEEHSIVGGFGGAVAEWLTTREGPAGRLVRFGTADEFLHVAGEQDNAREFYGLTVENIVGRIIETLR